MKSSTNTLFVSAHTVPVSCRNTFVAGCLRMKLTHFANGFNARWLTIAGHMQGTTRSSGAAMEVDVLSSQVQISLPSVRERMAVKLNIGDFLND